MKYTKIIAIFTVLILTGCGSAKATRQDSSTAPAATDSQGNTAAEDLKKPDITPAENTKSHGGSSFENQKDTDSTANAQTGTNSKNNGLNMEGTDTYNNIQAPETSQPLAGELDERLMKQGEHLNYFFKEEGSENCMSICTDEDETYLIYRFGTKDSLELEYPSATSDIDDSWNSFTYMYYFRGGGAENSGLDLNYLQFDIGSYKYIIYDEYLSEADSKDAGIMIYDMSAQRSSDNIEDRYMDFEPEYKLTVIKGNSYSIDGSLSLLRGNDKIKTELI